MKTENNIDNYFERVKQNPPLIEIEKVHQIINSPTAKARLRGKPYNLLKFTIMTTIFAVILSAFLLWPGNNVEKSGAVENGFSNQKTVESPKAILKANQPQEASLRPLLKSNRQKTEIRESVSAKSEPEELNEVRSENADIEKTRQKGEVSSTDVRQDQDKLNELMAKRDQILKTQKSNNSMKKSEVAYPEQILDSTFFIDLSRNELEKIGFRQKESKIDLHFLLNQGKMFTVYEDGHLVFGVVFDDNQQSKKAKRESNSTMSFYVEREFRVSKKDSSVVYSKGIVPMLVTDEKGNNLLKISLPESELKALFSKDFPKDFKTLLPVVIRKNVFGNQPKEDIIYWFLPTDEFFNRLPLEISKELMAEFKYVTAEDKSKLVQPECKYFDECKNTLNDIKFKVFPNPASSQVNVSFSLNEAITGRITLVDLAGRERQVLKSQTKFAIGPHQISVDVSAVPEGIYLITLYSDKGIQTQRFIVTR